METVRCGSVLIIGDGDFSFARSFLSTASAQISLVATVVETEASLCLRYQNASENIAYLREYPGKIFSQLFLILFYN